MAKQLATIMLPIILAFVLGVVSKKIIKVDGYQGFIKKCRNFIGTFLLPIIIFNSFLSSHYTLGYVPCAVSYALIQLAALGGGFLIRKKVKGKKTHFPHLMACDEGGMLGYPLAALLLPTVGSAKYALFDAGQTFFLFFALVPIIEAANGEKKSIWKRILGIFKSPVVDAMILGLILGGFGVYDAITASSIATGWSTFMSVLMMIVTYGVIFTIGVDFSVEKSMFKTVVTDSLTRLVLQIIAGVIIGFVLFLIVPFEKELLLVLSLALVIPPPFCITAFGDFGEDVEYANNVVSISTIITMICYAVLLVVSMAV